MTWENSTGTSQEILIKKPLGLWGSQNTPPSKCNGPLVSYAWPLSLELWYVGKTLRGERLNGGWAHKWPKNSLSLNSEPNDATIILYPMKVFEMSKLCTFLKAICIWGIKGCLAKCQLRLFIRSQLLIKRAYHNHTHYPTITHIAHI